MARGRKHSQRRTTIDLSSAAFGWCIDGRAHQCDHVVSDLGERFLVWPIAALNAGAALAAQAAL